jgi:Matrixin
VKLVNRRLFRPLLLAVLLFAIARQMAGFALEGPRWPDGKVVPLQFALGAATRVLLDGNTTWDGAAAPAADSWNQVMTRLRLQVDLSLSAPVAPNDGVNAVVFSDRIYGQSFPPSGDVLAVTAVQFSGSTLHEADVIFNKAFSFDSYRGPLRFKQDGLVDIRRVLLHELGHVIGLAHPDQQGQHVEAIMNSVISNRDTLSADDINGARYLYGNASPAPTPVATPGPSRFGGVSTRANVGIGNDVLIAGFIVKGLQPKDVVVRALGPTLSSFHVANSLTDPVLELHNSTGALIASNDDWQTGDQGPQIFASGYAPPHGLESALLATLLPGSYTAIVRGFNNTTGVALAEVYQLDFGATHLFNISSRGRVGTADAVMIAGLTIHGTTIKRVIVRAIGPSLAAPPFLVPGTLNDPTLELHNAFGALLATNNDWITGSQVGTISASGYAPRSGKESAIIANLGPGNYTAIVRGVANTTGIALVEAYDLDP